MKQYRHLLASSLLLACLGINAQQKATKKTAKDSVSQLQEVLINKANKYTKSESDYVARMPIKNIENAQVYNIVTKELMKDQLVINQDDAMKNVPGMYQLWGATNRAGDGGSYFASRGFVTQSLLRNGIAGKITNNADVTNLERIESIKGPSATLFGSILTSYGGLINRVTKKPYDGFNGEFGYQTGSYGLNRLTADVNTPINDDHSALFRVNASYNSSNTFQDFGYSKSYFFAPAFSYQINNKLNILAEAELSNLDASGMPLIYLPWGQTPSSLGINNAKDLDMNFRRSFVGDEFMTNNATANIFAQANYKFANKWNSQSVLSSSSNKSGGIQTWFYLLPNKQMSRNAWNPNGRDNILEFQQNFNGEFNIGKIRNRVLIGGDALHTETKLSYGYLKDTFFYFDTVNYAEANANYYDFNPINVSEKLIGGGSSKTHSSVTTLSTYAADVINLTDKLIVSGALRFDHYINNGIFDAANNKTTGDYSQNALSPKLGLVYQIVKDQLSVFGNYQNSFKNNGYLYANANQTLELRKFDPEKANQFEAGIKANAFDSKLSANLSYYDIKVKDIVRTDPTLVGASIQDGNQISKGFELEVTANPIPGLNFIIGYAKNNSKLQKADSTVDGLRPVTAGPENLINYWLSYNIQNRKLKGLGFGFGGNYADETFIYNQRASAGSPVETFALPSYAIINASVNYDQPKYRLTIKMNNITDELYFNGYTTINVQAPRTIMGSLTYKF